MIPFAATIAIASILGWAIMASRPSPNPLRHLLTELRYLMASVADLTAAVDKNTAAIAALVSALAAAKAQPVPDSLIQQIDANTKAASDALAA